MEPGLRNNNNSPWKQVVVCFVVVVSVLSLAVENLRCRSSRGLVNERPAMISTQVAAARYERGSYCNKADFDFIQRLAERLHDAGACERESNGRLTVMMGVQWCERRSVSKCACRRM